MSEVVSIHVFFYTDLLQRHHECLKKRIVRPQLRKRRIASGISVVMMATLHAVPDEEEWSTLHPRRFTLNKRTQVSSRQAVWAPEPV